MSSPQADETGIPPGLLAGDAEAMELRIALVCYGGVSLAVYMHGITKELQSLVRASRAMDAGQPPPGGTERAYYDQLLQLREAGLPVDVTIDLISGTSAGGINGVCLAKALVVGSDQEGLTRLWMQKGDITKLLRSGGFLGWPLAGLLTAVRLPFRAGREWAPLDGDRMNRWLHDALAEMDRRGTGQRQLRDGGTLDLHVTATDLRGTDQIVPLGGGGGLHDRTYARSFTFSSHPEVAAAVAGHRPPADRTPPTIADDRGALAFVARATSSFPGAFPPVSLRDFAAALGRASRRRFDAPDLGRHLLPDYDLLRGQDATRVYLMDGGVLDNAPFDHVVDAISRQPAGREVTRHVVYIEPDPGRGSPGAPLPRSSGRARPPTWREGVTGALLTVPHHQPLLRSIRQLAAVNEQTATVGRIAGSLQDDVDDRLIRLGAGDALSGPVDFESVRARAAAIYRAVPEVIGAPNFSTYGRLKMQSIAHRLAADLSAYLAYPPSSPRAGFLRAALFAWLHERPQWDGEEEARQEWLGPLDVPYRERRLAFIIAGINGLFSELTTRQVAAGSTTLPDGPSREQLADVKRRAWALLVAERGKPAAAIEAVAAGTAFAAPGALTVEVLVSDPQGWADAHAGAIGDLVEAYTEELRTRTAHSAEDLWAEFSSATRDWGDTGARARLASRYVGFPLWDALLFPVQSLSGLALLNQVRTSRFSPRDATALTPPARGFPRRRGTKLRGVGTHHFGAFFGLDRRQNDYLWGRLDGAELILGLLRRQQEDRRPPDAPQLPTGASMRAQALIAVLDQERGSLTEVRGLVRKLRRQVRRQA